MSATLEIDERNGSPAGTLTHNISNVNMGSIDSPSLDATANPVIPGQPTYEKWQQIHVTNMGGSSKIDNLKVWRTGALGGSAVHKTNLSTSSYAGAAVYAQPVNTTSTVATNTMPASLPSTANLGIGGSLGGSLTTTGSSDYIVDQILSNGADTAGSVSTKNYQWDETA